MFYEILSTKKIHLHKTILYFSLIYADLFSSWFTLIYLRSSAWNLPFLFSQIYADSFSRWFALIYLRPSARNLLLFSLICADFICVKSFLFSQIYADFICLTLTSCILLSASICVKSYFSFSLICADLFSAPICVFNLRRSARDVFFSFSLINADLFFQTINKIFSANICEKLFLPQRRKGTKVHKAIFHTL